MRDDADRLEEFRRAVLPWHRELYGAALRLTRSAQEAEDLVQDAWLRAWAFRERFEPGTNGRAWMHRILMNTFINGYRRRRREREVLAEVRSKRPTRDAWWSPQQGPAVQDPPARALDGVGDEVQTALDALPEEFRTVVRMVDMDDCSYREAASRLGCPVGTVMSRLHRGRRALKERLQHYAEDTGYVAAA